MFREHKFLIWGTICKCGKVCGILQNKHHPWDKCDFEVAVECENCGESIIIDSSRAEEFYNNKILSHFKNVEGRVLDLGCGGGFLSRYLIDNPEVSSIYGLDYHKESEEELQDLIQRDKFQFINDDIKNIGEIFEEDSVDYSVSRDVFMFIKDTEKFFDEITRITRCEIRQMGWFIKDNQRMQNKLMPEDIAEEYRKRGWKVQIEYLNWYKCGYFIRAYK